MRSLLRGGACLVLLALAGCNFGSEPQAIDLSFVPAHILNADGTCGIRFEVQALGFGSAQWEAVRILRGGVPVLQLTGEQTRDFWGATRIVAGETQDSEPYTIPATATDYTVEVDYRVTGPSRTISLPVDCTPDS